MEISSLAGKHLALKQRKALREQRQVYLDTDLTSCSRP